MDIISTILSKSQWPALSSIFFLLCSEDNKDNKDNKEKSQVCQSLPIVGTGLFFSMVECIVI